jgi:hypothetical protein
MPSAFSSSQSGAWSEIWEGRYFFVAALWRLAGNFAFFSASSARQVRGVGGHVLVAEQVAARSFG